MAQIPLAPPTQAQATPEAQTEALRRRAELGASSATLGAETANSPAASNPLAQEGLTPTPAPIEGGAAGTQSDSQVAGLKQQKTEAQTITSALITRQKKLGDQGQ